MDDTALDVRIVQQIAAHDGVDPIELDPPLYEVVDVDALETLVGAGSSGHDAFTGSVSFDYYGYEVTVDHEGDVDVTPAPVADVQADPAPTPAASGVIGER